MYWQVGIIGLACCLLGIYLFVKNVFEENKSIFNAIMFMILGVFLISWATAIYYGWVQ